MVKPFSFSPVAIDKAEKHMEAHIVAAHSAIIIAYLLKNASESGQQNASSKAKTRVKAIEPERLKLKLTSGSFTSLVEVIDKYMSFMDVLVSLEVMPNRLTISQLTLESIFLCF